LKLEEDNLMASAISCLLTTHDLCRYFRRGRDEVRALDGVDLAVERGDFLAVVGSSGCGKSTLLATLAGLDTPTDGRVEVEGRSLYAMSRRELAAYRAHKVGMVFQSFNLIAHYTAAQNVETALLFNDTPRHERQSRAAAVLEQLGLTDRATHRPADLSGGEQQRVAIARAIVKEPEILLADEPTGNLDHDNALRIVDMLAQLNRDGLTVVMVTHNLELANQYASHIVRMHYGRILGQKTPARHEGGLS
jgi:putative ABC transport system ATP-binding protein